jgi:hypothetical protein
MTETAREASMIAKASNKIDVIPLFWVKNKSKITIGKLIDIFLIKVNHKNLVGAFIYYVEKMIV